MKKILLIILSIVMTLSLSAHKINGYRFIHVQESGNILGVEERLTEHFVEMGFKTVASYDIEDMSSSDKSELLIATYNWNIVNGGHSTLVVTLSDVVGSVIFRAAGQGISFTAKGDMKNALKKVFKQLDALNYYYDSSTNKAKGGSLIPFAKWTEDSIKTYLRQKKVSSLEGIYKNYSNFLDYYRIAILKHESTYYGIILETENKLWEKGDTKIVLNPLEKNTYDVEYYSFKGKKLNSIATFENRILTFNIGGNNGKIDQYQFLKIYPASRSEETSDESTQMDSSVKATGSGFVISGNIVATNYHVVDGADNIKVVLNINGTPEEYKAKVLISDKTNDLALLSIKDEKYKGLPPAPYKIITNTIDVGSSIFTMGYPMANVLGKEVKITDGIISSRTGYENDAVTYQISAAIQPGNSGGALFDKKGNLVGITNAGIRSADNIGYAIKSSYLINLIDSAPIDIKLPEGSNMAGKELSEIIKAYTPYLALIKIYE